MTMAWQSIDTAPTDGTWIILTGGEIDSYWGGESTPSAVIGQFCDVGAAWQFAWYDSGFYGEYSEPTHWMPLPPRPEASSVQEDVPAANALRDALKGLMPVNLNLAAHLPDDMIIPLDVTVGELRRASAALKPKP